jgi:VanZ family protein
MFSDKSLSRLEGFLRFAAVVLAVGMPIGLYIGGAQPVAVGLFPWPWSKVVHGLTFGVLAMAMGYASGLGGWRMVLLGFVGSVAVGALDEWHQAYLPGRHGQLSDVGFDALGAALGAYLLTHHSAPSRPE